MFYKNKTVDKSKKTLIENPTLKKEGLSNKTIGIIAGVIVLIIIIVVVVVVVFVVLPRTKSSKNTSIPPKKPPQVEPSEEILEDQTEEKPIEPVKEQNSVEEGKQVFSVNYNGFNYDEAPYVCEVLNGELATYEQLVESAKNGANWCNMGWFKEQYIPEKKGTFNSGYPVQKAYFDELKNLPLKENEKNMCGSTWESIKEDDIYSIQNLSSLPHNSRRGVNCYGVKSNIKHKLNEINKYVSPRQLDQKQNKIKQKIEKQLNDNENWKARIAFNDKKWSRYS